MGASLLALAKSIYYFYVNSIYGVAPCMGTNDL